MKFELLGSRRGREIGAPHTSRLINRLSLPETEAGIRPKNVRANATASPSKVSGASAWTKSTISEPYPGDATLGVSAFIPRSGGGRLLPLTCSYGKMSGSSRFISVTPCPVQLWATWRWKTCTRQLSRTNDRDTE